MGHLQIIKEHRHVCRRVTGVNIKISAGSDGQIHEGHRREDAIGADLLEAAAGRDKIELVVEEHPVQKGMRSCIDDIGTSNCLTLL